MDWTNAAIVILIVCFVVVCLLMGLVIMMQRSKQEGLGAAFGGGFTDSVWGAQTSQVLVKATVWLAALFFIISIALARLYTHRANMERSLSPLQEQLLRATPGSGSSKTPLTPAQAKPLPAGTVPTQAVTPYPNLPTTNAVPAKPAK